MPDYELILNYEKCTGCQTCEAACSLRHGCSSNLQRSRIRIVRIEGERSTTSIPVVCMRCEEHPCMQVCPAEAISVDSMTGATVINDTKCLGCKTCIYICPFGAAALDLSRGKTFICDLCEGDPICARFCPFDAIQYVRRDDMAIQLKRDKSEKIIKSLKAGS